MAMHVRIRLSVFEGFSIGRLFGLKFEEELTLKRTDRYLTLVNTQVSYQMNKNSCSTTSLLKISFYPFSAVYTEK